MKRRILAAILSILLAVSFILSLPVTVRANTWDETIAHYDRVFAVIDGEPEMKFPELYTALLLNPDMFVSQLAFRDKEVKEYALQVLTGDWVSPEQWFNIQEALDSAEMDFEAEKLLVRDIKDYRSYLSYQNVGIVTDCKALFDQVLTADGFYATDLAYDLAYAFIGTPETFILELSEEEKDVQDRVSLLLQEHQYSFLGTKIYESIPAFIPDLKPEDLYILGVIIAAAQNYPRIYQQTDPDPEALKQWKEAGLTPPVFTAHNYDRLFDFSLGSRTATLAEALLNDTANFVNELAYQDAKAKQDVFDALTDTSLEDWQLMQMYLCLQQYQEDTVLNKSQTTLVEALMYHLDYAYCGRGQPHRDISVLFNTSPDEGNTTPRFYTFCRELKFTFLEDPYYFLFQLEEQDESRQEYLIRCLMYTEDNSDALTRQVSTQWFREAAADYYTEDQHEMIKQCSAYAAVFKDPPKPSDPDPEEYAQWLKDKGLLVDDPGMTLPIYPDQSNPAESAATEETQPTDTTEKDTGWVSTVCFTLGFLCIGIATGNVIAKKKKAKKAKQDEALQQAAAEVPVKIYPKLLYCPAPLSRESQKQISQVLREKYDEYSVHWYSIKETDGTCRCYGTDNGYDIIFYAGGLRMEIPASCTVGECAFLFETSFELYAHKDGQLTDLDAALKQGLVSRQAIQAALDKHNSISR